MIQIQVVFQGCRYWLEVSFAEQIDRAQVEPCLVRMEGGHARESKIDPTRFREVLPERVATWVIAPDKSVTVFIESLPPGRRKRAIELYDQAIKSALAQVAKEFHTRTGAQGKTRVPCEVGYVVVCHGEAHDGSPHWHHHVGFESRVRVAGSDKTYALHARELYAKRKLLDVCVAHEVAHAFQREFGVRVERKAGHLRLPDVPRSLCRSAATRTKQINQYIQDHKLPNSPLTRRYVSLITRRQHADPEVGRAAFQERLRESRFQGESICQTVNRPHDPPPDATRPATRQVVQSAKELARQRGVFTRNELLRHSLRDLGPTYSLDTVVRAVDRVLKHPERAKIHVHQEAERTPRYSMRESTQAWKKVIDQVESVARDPEQPKRVAPPEPTPTRDADRRSRHEQKSSQTRPDAARRLSRPAQHSDPGPSHTKPFERLLRRTQVVGALGRAGIEFVKKAIELYQVWRKPIWHVHGVGNRQTPGSVAAAVRDLQKLSLLESHRRAFQAMRKINARSLDERLTYGEAVFRACRRPQFRVPKTSLVVITDAGAARPKELAVLLQKARAANAKVILVEREQSRSTLVQFAKSMQPGQVRTLRTPEQQR